jgi:hypothetical protein
MIPLLILAAVAQPLAAGEARAPYDCPSSGPRRWVHSDELELAYGRHSVAIVNAALRGDDSFLARAVGTDATFSYFQGDMGLAVGARGPEAARRFFRTMNPRAFQFLSLRRGALADDPCDLVRLELLLTGDSPARAFALTFSYRNGRLVEVGGREAGVVSGTLQPARRARRRR